MARIYKVDVRKMDEAKKRFFCRKNFPREKKKKHQGKNESQVCFPSHCQILSSLVVVQLKKAGPNQYVLSIFL